MDKTRVDLAVYCLETAKQCITSAKALIGISDYKGAAGLKAIEELGKLDEDRRKGRLPGPVRKRGIASNEM